MHTGHTTDRDPADHDDPGDATGSGGLGRGDLGEDGDAAGSGDPGMGSLGEGDVSGRGEAGDVASRRDLGRGDTGTRGEAGDGRVGGGGVSGRGGLGEGHAGRGGVGGGDPDRRDDLDDAAASRLLRLFEGRRLTPVQRRIAHCLAQHAAEAPFLSSIEVAELAGVSQPSVTRFAMALGYTGYPDLRRRFRELDVRSGRGGVTRGSRAASEFVEPLPATADPRRPSGDDTRRPPSRDVRPEAHLPRSTSAAPETPAGQDASVHPVPPVGTEMSADPASAADKETSAHAVSSVGGEVCAGPVTSGDRETSVSQEASLRSVPPFDGEVSAHPVPSADGETSGGSVPYMGSDSGAAPRPGVATRRGVARGRGLGEEYRRAVLAEIENLRALARALEDPEPVAAAARVLAASRPLPVLGLRAAAAQAAGFAYFAAKVHPDVRLLQETGSLLADRVEQAAAAGATALLCFALPRYPAELVDALRAARTAGLSVVTVADRSVPPIAGLSDVLLTAAVGTHLVFDTACAPMLLGQVLLEAMCDELPGAQARLEAFETSAAARGVFLID